MIASPGTIIDFEIQPGAGSTSIPRAQISMSTSNILSYDENNSFDDIEFDTSTFNASMSYSEFQQTRRFCQESIKTRIFSIFWPLISDKTTNKVAYYGPATHNNLGDCFLSLGSIQLLEVSQCVHRD